MEQIISWLFFTDSIADFWAGNGASFILACAALAGCIICILSKKIRKLLF